MIAAKDCRAKLVAGCVIAGSKIGREMLLLALRACFYKKKNMPEEAITLFMYGIGGSDKERKRSLEVMVHNAADHVSLSLSRKISTGFNVKDDLSDSKLYRKISCDISKLFGELIKSKSTLAGLANSKGEFKFGCIAEIMEKAISKESVPLLNQVILEFEELIVESSNSLYTIIKDEYESSITRNHFDHVVTRAIKHLSMTLSFEINAVFINRNMPTDMETNIDITEELHTLRSMKPFEYPDDSITEELIATLSSGITKKREWELMASKIVDQSISLRIDRLVNDSDNNMSQSFALAARKSFRKIEADAISSLHEVIRRSYGIMAQGKRNSSDISKRMGSIDLSEETKGYILYIESTIPSVIRKIQVMIDREVKEGRLDRSELEKENERLAGAEEIIADDYMKMLRMAAMIKLLPDTEQDERDYTNRRWRSIESRVMNLEDRGRRQDSEYNHGSERGRRAFASRDMGRGGSRVRGGRTMGRGRGNRVDTNKQKE